MNKPLFIIGLLCLAFCLVGDKGFAGCWEKPRTVYYPVYSSPVVVYPSVVVPVVEQRTVMVPVVQQTVRYQVVRPVYYMNYSHYYTFVPVENEPSYNPWRAYSY